MNNEKELIELRNALLAEINSVDFIGKPAELYEPIEYTMQNTGKLLRPVLLLLSCKIFSDHLHFALKPAIAIEIFHNFTLVHDDIMDNAPLRRKKPTVYKKWNADIALLVGDVMLIKAFQKLQECDLAVRERLINIFNETAIKVCEGQQLDMNFENKPISKEEYLNMIGLKTAALIACSMAMGAICGEANSADVNKMYDAGWEIGMAFQIQDDLIDTFGKSGKSGKINGGDIRAGKKNWPFLIALDVAGKQDEKRLKELLSEEEIDADKKVNQVMEIYKRLNVETRASISLKKHYADGIKLLKKINGNKINLQLLIDYINTLPDREN